MRFGKGNEKIAGPRREASRALTAGERREEDFEKGVPAERQTFLRSPYSGTGYPR